MRSMGVYIHIPFCIKKCVYCDFLSAPAIRQRQQEYVEALKRELEREAHKYNGYEASTVFFGGGTPSILEEADIGRILGCLNKHYKIDGQAEVTLEMNPKTTDRNKLLQLKSYGINRLSIGLQSADNAELKLLGRVHTYEDFLKAYHQAREAGFGNINIDVMSALPGQGINSWRRTLEKVTALEPEHISAYSLIIEEGTALYDSLEEYPPVPGEDEDREMYCLTKRFLAEKGYGRYEISNYAKAGYECRHNLAYWQRGKWHAANYVGFGLGASSLFENVRWKNTADMERYIGGGAREGIQKLTRNDCMEEFMFLGLRVTGGVSKAEFAESFGVGIEAVYGDIIRKWIKQGMLAQDGDFVRLTDAGIDVSNAILSGFLL